MKVKVIKASYNFATQGGAIGDIDLGVSLPKGVIVMKVTSDEVTTETGGTSITLNVKNQAGSKQALTGAIDFTGDATIQNRALAGSVAGIKLSSSGKINATVATAAVTAGAINFYIEYYN